jgi:hypothetical protein
VKGLGKFEDVFVEYLDGNCRKRHIFVQIKSKTKRCISMKQLLAENEEFSLRKLYKSYQQIEEKFNSSELGVKMEGSFDDSLFVIYTNADIEPTLQSIRENDIGEEKLLLTGGYLLQFNEREHQVIYNHLKDLPKFRDFLRKFRIFYSQVNEKSIDFHIKSEIQQSMDLYETDLQIAYTSFIDFMKDWWQNKNFFLKDTNKLDKDTLSKTSEILRKILGADSRMMVLNPMELEAAISSC